VRAVGWSNGSVRPSGAGLGVKISQADRDRHFAHRPASMLLELPTGETTRVSLSPSFWRSCPELRSAVIGRWLLTSGYAPWPPRTPPEFELERRGEERLLLKVLSPRATQASAQPLDEGVGVGLVRD